jgi:acetyl-CoA carboxylase carboxyltransferase component
MTTKTKSRLRELTEDYLRLEDKLKLGGGPEKIEKIHKQGKLTARERIDLLLDKDSVLAGDRSTCSLR